jgi:voltage-gated potassium channel
MDLKIRNIWNQVLTLFAMLFLVAFSYPAFVENISISTQRYLDFIQWSVWIVFAVDLLIGFLRSKEKSKFLLQHPLDVAAVLLPFLRPLRLMRVISFGGLVLQKIVIGKQLTVTIKVLITGMFLTYVGAIQMTVTERNIPSSNIKNFGDGLWWAITTVTTVGYGDKYPTTFEGKFLAVILMLTGISIMGVITATIATWFIEMSRSDKNR